MCDKAIATLIGVLTARERKRYAIKAERLFSTSQGQMHVVNVLHCSQVKDCSTPRFSLAGTI